MSGKLAPRRTGKMKKQVVRLSYTRVFKQPATKRRRGKGTKIGKMEVVLHHRVKDL